jgi:hypothetical protein
VGYVDGREQAQLRVTVRTGGALTTRELEVAKPVRNGVRIGVTRSSRALLWPIQRPKISSRMRISRMTPPMTSRSA